MSANLIPKEKQTAYQRWELASFGDSRPVEKEKEKDEKKDNVKKKGD